MPGACLDDSASILKMTAQSFLSFRLFRACEDFTAKRPPAEGYAKNTKATGGRPQQLDIQSFGRLDRRNKRPWLDMSF
jgi:hypothetical protein